MLFCTPLKTTYGAQDVYKVVSTFIATAIVTLGKDGGCIHWWWFDNAWVLKGIHCKDKKPKMG